MVAQIYYTRKTWKLLDISYILIGVVVTRVHAFVKTHQIISLESVQFTLGKFYLLKKKDDPVMENGFDKVWSESGKNGQEAL